MPLKQGESRRDDIIRAGAELIYARGYTATGLQDILDRASVPKGSFYFYFRSKEDFGIEIINHFASLVGGMFSGILLDGAVTPMVRLEKLFTFFESYYRKKGYTGGCPIGNLSLEMADVSEKFRKRLEAVIDEMVGHIERCLKDGVSDGSFTREIDTAGTARFIFHGFEGALLHMKVTKSIGPLRAYKNQIFDYLRRLGRDAGKKSGGSE